MMRASPGRLLSRILQAAEGSARSLYYRYIRYAWVYFGKGVKFSGPLHCLGSNGKIAIGSRVFLGPWVSLSVAEGGIIEVGSDCSINKSSIVSALVSVRVGRRCRIGENVSIRDNDHHIDGRNPVHGSGFDTARRTAFAPRWPSAMSWSTRVFRTVTIENSAATKKPLARTSASTAPSRHSVSPSVSSMAAPATLSCC